MQSNDNILSGVRVVELATVVFVPSSGTVMGDFGAEVIKIEPPGGGDIYRRFHELPGMPDSDVDYCWQASRSMFLPSSSFEVQIFFCRNWSRC